MAPGLDALRALGDTANRYRGQLAWDMRLGLFQGAAVGEEASAAYHRELNGALLPKIGEEFKRRLETSAAQPDKLYQYLKAYLMLGEPQHLDKTQLAFLVNLDWQEALASDPNTLHSLSTHLKTLLDAQDRLRPLPLDDELVAQTRNTLRQASLPRLMYNQLKLSNEDDTSHDLRLDIASGVGADRVLMRKSGKPLSQPVHGLYTRAVFDKLSGLGTVDLVKQFSQDAWVMGDKSLDVQGSARLASEVMDVYADDYIQIWDGILNDVEIRPMQSLAQAAELLTSRRRPDFPIARVFDHRRGEYESDQAARQPDGRRRCGGSGGKGGYQSSA